MNTALLLQLPPLQTLGRRRRSQTGVKTTGAEEAYGGAAERRQAPPQRGRGDVDDHPPRWTGGKTGRTGRMSQPNLRSLGNRRGLRNEPHFWMRLFFAGGLKHKDSSTAKFQGERRSQMTRGPTKWREPPPKKQKPHRSERLTSLHSHTSSPRLQRRLLLSK